MIKKLLTLTLAVSVLTTIPSYADIRIAVIDSGVSVNDFMEKSIDRSSAYNFVDDNIDTTNDQNGHGTKVASVITQKISEYEDIRVIPIKTTDEHGKSSTENVIKAIDYCINNNIDIINISSGKTSYDEDLNNAIQSAISNDIIIVAGGGNTGKKEYFYPASYDNVVAVGGIGVNNNITWFSTHNDKIKLVAPASHIDVIDNNGSYIKGSGTSFSAPYVSAQIAILKSKYPEYSNQQILDVLYETSIDGGDIGLDNYYGYGVADIELSIKRFIDVINEKYVSWSTNLTTDEVEKVFKVMFNHNIQDTGNISVVDEYFNEYPIMLTVNDNLVEVKPKYQWETNQIMTLKIKDVIGISNKVLKEEVRMKMKVNSKNDRSKRMSYEDFNDFVDMPVIE